MNSAFRLSSIGSSSDPASCLFAALNELLRAVDGRVVLLRPLTASFDSQRDDIDLLLTESQREQLLHAAFAQCKRGRIHCRIQRSSPSKVQLILWTINCSQKLMIDLWTSFDQLARRRECGIPAERLLNALTASVTSTDAPGAPPIGERRLSALRYNTENFATANNSHTDNPVIKQFDDAPATEKIPALRQLPPDIDLCLLIQHLATKQKKLTTLAVRERIARSCDRLSSWSPQQSSQQVPCDLLTVLRDVADHLPQATTITPELIALSEVYLLQRLACVPNNRGLPVLERRRRRGLLTGLRKFVLKHRPTIAVIGSDGAGKSSVVSALANLHPQATSLVAKKFYRRSLTYQFISGLMKRFQGADRGIFDDNTAPLITLRAIAAAWLRISLPSRPGSKTGPSIAVTTIPHSDHGLNESLHFTILDRSISSFLITGRKSDTPNQTHGATWIESLIPPVTSILLALPFSDLTRRKQEMSAAGHDTYQRMLFEQALRQQPNDLILLANQPSAQAAAMAICELLRHDRQSVELSTETSGSRRAAA